MKKVLLIVVILLWAGLAQADPFLVTDVTPSADVVTSFKVFFDGGAAVNSAPVAGALKYDLASISQGSHTVKVQACNAWGCSNDSSPFSFNKKIPGAPVNLRIP